MHIILTGGGTAGHVMPNVAIIEELKAEWPNINITYIGSKNGMEKDLLKDQPVEFKSVSVGKLRRYFSLQNISDLLRVPKGILQARKIIKNSNAELVFSKGGYVGLPVVIGAWLSGVPAIIHESDSIPGLATKITKPFAKEAWSSYPIKGFKQVSLPVRKALKKGDGNKYKSSKPTLLIMGGSQGAQAINDFIYRTLDDLTQDFQVIHITGPGMQKEIKKENYLSFEYVKEELSDIYAAADYVLCRAGASTLNELKNLNKKAILVPLPTTKSRGEQLTNARIFAEKYPATIIPELELSRTLIAENILQLNEKEYPQVEDTPLVANLFSAYLTR